MLQGAALRVAAPTTHLCSECSSEAARSGTVGRSSKSSRLRRRPNRRPQQNEACWHCIGRCFVAGADQGKQAQAIRKFTTAGFEAGACGDFFACGLLTERPERRPAPPSSLLLILFMLRVPTVDDGLRRRPLLRAGEVSREEFEKGIAAAPQSVELSAAYAEARHRKSQTPPAWIHPAAAVNTRGRQRALAAACCPRRSHC